MQFIISSGGASKNKRHIDFRTPAQKKRQLNKDEKKTNKPQVYTPCEDALQAFFHGLSLLPQKAAILRILYDYAHEFVPLSCNAKFPKPLSELYKPEELSSPYLPLLTKCEEVFVSIAINIYLCHTVCQNHHIIVILDFTIGM